MNHSMNQVFDDFTLHAIQGQISTIYLAVYPGKVLVLDGGCRNDALKIERYVTRKLRRPMSSVKLAIASHSHPDHAGGSPVLTRKFGMPLAAPAGINNWYKGLSGCLQHKIDTVLAYHVSRATKKPFENLLYPRHVHFDVALTDGLRLPDFEDWVVYDSPGHTSHDIVVYHEKFRVLYAADVILSVNGKYLLPFPVPLEKKMHTSLDRIGELDVKTLLLAHGGSKKIQDIKELTKNLGAQLEKGLPPMLEKLKILESFSPEIRKDKKRRGTRKK